MVDATIERFGRLDIAHNNAGIMGAGADIIDMDDAVWQRGIDVMLTGRVPVHEARDPPHDRAGRRAR